MAIMPSKTYDALICAGAPDKARDAAEELADYENRLASIDNQLAVMNRRFLAIEGRLGALEGKLNLVISATGINAAAAIATLGVLLRHA
jgi:phage shock protein A